MVGYFSIPEGRIVDVSDIHAHEGRFRAHALLVGGAHCRSLCRRLRALLGGESFGFLGDGFDKGLRLLAPLIFRAVVGVEAQIRVRTVHIAALVGDVRVAEEVAGVVRIGVFAPREPGHQRVMGFLVLALFHQRVGMRKPLPPLHVLDDARRALRGKQSCRHQRRRDQQPAFAHAVSPFRRRAPSAQLFHILNIQRYLPALRANGHLGLADAAAKELAFVRGEHHAVARALHAQIAVFLHLRAAAQTFAHSKHSLAKTARNAGIPPRPGGLFFN